MRNVKTLRLALTAVAALTGLLNIAGCPPADPGALPPDIGNPANGGNTQDTLAARGTGLDFTPADEYAKVPVYKPTLGGLGADGLPQTVDLTQSGRFPAPGDQGSQQSCTGWACGYAVKTYLEAGEGNYAPSTADKIFSPAFLYYFTNRAAGDPNQCRTAAVSTIKNVLDLMKQRGATTLDRMPYDANTCAVSPSQDALQHATSFAIRDYVRLTSLDEIRRNLSEGNPVVIGIAVGPAFQLAAGSQWTAQDYQSDLQNSAGGHAFVIVGYDDARRTLKVMNSWGVSWGQGGFWFISYDVITTAAQLSAQGNPLGLLELWVIFDQQNTAPVQPQELPRNENPASEITASLLALTNTAFTVPATDEAGQLGVNVSFGLEISGQLLGDEITCLLAILNEETGELLAGFDGLGGFGGFVSASGTIFVSGDLQLPGLSLFLPFEDLGLAGGAYTLRPVLAAFNADGSQIAALAGETFTLQVDAPQIDPSIPLGFYSGIDDEGFFVDFEIDANGNVFGSLTAPDPFNPFFVFDPAGFLDAEGRIVLNFDLSAFGGFACQYVGVFIGPGFGGGEWFCANGTSGTWSFGSEGP